jgi:hypothetical protein
MFGLRQQQLAQLNAEMAELRKQASEISAEMTEARKLGITIRRQIEEWGNAMAAKHEAEAAVETARQFAERLGQRVASLESSNGRLNGLIYQHEKVFRALGADMMLRATGGGSVAPPAPAEP